MIVEFNELPVVHISCCSFKRYYIFRDQKIREGFWIILQQKFCLHEKTDQT